MTTIAEVRADLYRIELPITLSDSTHGEMRAFELCTVRVRDAMARKGSATPLPLAAMAAASTTSFHASCPSLVGEDADRIEQLWQKLWWALHYGGRGGPTVSAISAIDMALWDLKAKRAGTACGACWAATIPGFPATPGASISTFAGALLRRPMPISRAVFAPSR